MFAVGKSALSIATLVLHDVERGVSSAIATVVRDNHAIIGIHRLTKEVTDSKSPEASVVPMNHNGSLDR